MKEHGSVAIFEAQAALYSRRHGRLAPGKSEPLDSAVDSGDDENRAQFDNWKAIHAYVDALNYICTLQEVIEAVGSVLDGAWGDISQDQALVDAAKILAPYTR